MPSDQFMVDVILQYWSQQLDIFGLIKLQKKIWLNDIVNALWKKGQNAKLLTADFKVWEVHGALSYLYDTVWCHISKISLLVHLYWSSPFYQKSIFTKVFGTWTFLFAYSLMKNDFTRQML